MNPPHTAFEVADAFVAHCNACGDLLTNLKLQKLLYYAQGWHLGYTGEALFPEDFEAWIHGPVCPPVYGAYKRFGHRAIDADPPVLSGPLADHVADMWQAYGHLSAYDLERLSHSESPWRSARGELSADQPSTAVVSKDSMLAFFRAEASKSGD